MEDHDTDDRPQLSAERIAEILKHVQLRKGLTYRRIGELAVVAAALHLAHSDRRPADGEPSRIIDTINFAATAVISGSLLDELHDNAPLTGSVRGLDICCGNGGWRVCTP